MKKGFTLIEIIITTSIILLLSGLSLTLTYNFNQEKILRNEALKLVNVLEIAKKKANSGDLSGRICNGGFNGYRVIVRVSDYSLWLVCGGDLISPAIFSYNFPSSIKVLTDGTGDYNFRELNRALTSGTIRVRNLAISKCLNVNISPSGVITLSENFESC
jgi:prepilin-type N-terminal cleavage/methylation domain-containing protein